MTAVSTVDDPAVSRFGGTREPCALASAFLPSYPYTEMCAKSILSFASRAGRDATQRRLP